MPAQNVDLALVIDTSRSMKNCFDQLRQHLDTLLIPMQGSVSRIRYALVGASASKSTNSDIILYRIDFLNEQSFYSLYNHGPNDGDPHNKFFTDDPSKVKEVLAIWRPKGNEDMLLALDIAADLPFGPLNNTKRVIALFSDEPFEGGVNGKASNRFISELQNKLMARRIQLFAAIPEGPGAYELAQTDRSEIEFVEGGDGLRGVDFSLLFRQMGKSISCSSLQAVTEPSYKVALFGQDRWGGPGPGPGGWSNSD